jgi:hypothetical protein
MVSHIIMVRILHMINVECQIRDTIFVIFYLSLISLKIN